MHDGVATPAETRTRRIAPSAERLAPPSSGTGTDVARFLFKYLLFLLAVPLVVVVLVGALIYLLPQTYVAQATVLIEGRKSPTLRADPLSYPIETFEVISSEMEIITSRGVAETVVERLQLDRPSANVGWSRRIREQLIDLLDQTGLLQKVSRHESAIRAVQNNIELKQPAQSSILEIRYGADDPEQAALVARTITEAYIDRHQAIFSDNTASFFEARVGDAQSALDALRAALRRESDAARIAELQLQLVAEEKSFLFYRERLNTAKADAAAMPSLANVRVVDWPSVPSRPSLSRLLLLLLALLGGVVLALSLALLRDYFDHRVYSPDDLRKVCTVPVLGSVRRSGAARRLWKRGRGIA